LRFPNDNNGSQKIDIELQAKRKEEYHDFYEDIQENIKRCRKESLPKRYKKRNILVVAAVTGNFFSFSGNST